MLKCPYCYEILKEKGLRCPHCAQFIIDDVINVDFPSVDKKRCLFCGKRILAEAKFCRFCMKWLDSVNADAADLNPEDLL